MTHNEVKANFIIALWLFVEFANNDGTQISSKGEPVNGTDVEVC